MEDFKCRICGHKKYNWADVRNGLLACEGCGMVFNDKYKFSLNRKLNIKYLDNYKGGWGELEYVHEGDSGIDLKAAIDSSITIFPYLEQRFGASVFAWVPFGISVQPYPSDMDIKIYDRSGLSSKQGVGILNKVGVIDSIYTGELKGRFVNFGDSSYTIYPGQHVAQLVVEKRMIVDINKVDELEETERGAGGFGSTGE